MKKKDIEVEARSFLTDAEFGRILSSLEESARFIGELEEETVYFEAKKDLRLRRNGKDAFLILKEGKIHDDQRKEYEVKFDIGDFDGMEKLLESLGYKVQVRWFRKRREYTQGDLKILLDDTKGYGKILEIEKMAEMGKEDGVHGELAEKLKSFGIKVTPKEEFNKAFEYYKKNWRELTK